MGFTGDQLIAILNFYLFPPPILKATEKDKGFGLRRLRDYNWKESRDLSKLEGRSLKSSGIAMLCVIKADSIDQTLKSMDLIDKICTMHPRAVIKQNIKITVYEDGSIITNPTETRMECLFRHIRNSFAHNHTYYFENGNILIEDCDDNEKITARVLMPKHALLEWIDIVENGNQSKDMKSKTNSNVEPKDTN